MTYDSACSGTGGGREGSLGVFNGQTKLGLGSLVGSWCVFSAWHFQIDLSLLCEFLSKVLEQLHRVSNRFTYPKAASNDKRTRLSNSRPPSLSSRPFASTEYSPSATDTTLTPRLVSPISRTTTRLSLLSTSPASPSSGLPSRPRSFRSAFNPTLYPTKTAAASSRT